MLPKIDDAEAMAYIGRLTVLRKARAQTGKELRDLLIPMLNNLEGQYSEGWGLDGVVGLVEQINALTTAINELKKP